MYYGVEMKKKASPMTITQTNLYSYSAGNYAVSDLLIKNQGWKTISATYDSNVQYNSVYNQLTDTYGERIALSVTDAIDISGIENIRLRLQSMNSANATAKVIWNLE